MIANGIHLSRCLVAGCQKGLKFLTILSSRLFCDALPWIRGNSAPAQGCQSTSTSSKSQGLSSGHKFWAIVCSTVGPFVL